MLLKDFLNIKHNKLLRCLLLFGLLSSVIAQNSDLTNIAAQKNGATCTASVNSEDCYKALDGVVNNTPTYKWGFHGWANNSWFQVMFDDAYLVSEARFMQMFYDNECNFEDLKLTFTNNQDDSHHYVSLTEKQDSFDWEYFQFNPIMATSVNISVLTAHVYSPMTYNGYIELEFYGTKESKTTTTTTTTTTATINQPSATTPTTTTPEIIMPSPAQTTLTNIAALDQGSSCTASSNAEECSRALDGIASNSPTHKWGFHGWPNNTWFQISFADTYEISEASFMQMYYHLECNFKDLRLTFTDTQDNTHHHVSLTEKRNAFDWEHFEFDPVLASSVNISVQSAYEYLPNLYNGFTEIEIYAKIQSSSTTKTTTTALPITTPHRSPPSSNPKKPASAANKQKMTFEFKIYLPIIVGGLLLIVIIVSGTVCLLRRSNKHQRLEEEEGQSNADNYERIAELKLRRENEVRFSKGLFTEQDTLPRDDKKDASVVGGNVYITQGAVGYRPDGGSGDVDEGIYSSIAKPKVK